MEKCDYCKEYIEDIVELIDYDEVFCSDECAEQWYEQKCSEQDSRWEA